MGRMLCSMKSPRWSILAGLNLLALQLMRPEVLDVFRAQYAHGGGLRHAVDIQQRGQIAARLVVQM